MHNQHNNKSIYCYFIFNRSLPVLNLNTFLFSITYVHSKERDDYFVPNVSPSLKYGSDQIFKVFCSMLLPPSLFWTEEAVNN